MHLVQLFLPTTDNAGHPLPRELFARVRDELVDRFGGLTTHTRAPADGLWREDAGDATVGDELLIYEVVVEQLDHGWWRGWLASQEAHFRQERLHVRAMPMELL